MTSATTAASSGCPRPRGRSASLALRLRRAGPFYVPRLPEPNDPRYERDSHKAIAGLLEASQGRAFVLFTSYRAMKSAYQALANDIAYPAASRAICRAPSCRAGSKRRPAPSSSPPAPSGRASTCRATQLSLRDHRSAALLPCPTIRWCRPTSSASRPRAATGSASTRCRRPSCAQAGLRPIDPDRTEPASWRSSMPGSTPRTTGANPEGPAQREAHREPRHHRRVARPRRDAAPLRGGVPLEANEFLTEREGRAVGGILL